MLNTALPMHLAGAFVTALTLSVVGTYAVRTWARGRGYVDLPDFQRRIHSHPTPNVGGIAVAFATTITFLIWSGFVMPGQVARPEIIAVLMGGLAMLVVGFWDDTRHVKATTKLALQIVVTVSAFAMGVRVLGIGIEGAWPAQLAGLLGLLVTSTAVVVTTNAFNLIDGSDGVASGVALFAAATLAIVFVLNSDPLGALLATVMVGTCVGFLAFNFPPASIFLGDSGSLFLGFTLASLGVITTKDATTAIAVVIPVVAFGLPLLDTSMAIVRRFLQHRSLFSPDRQHIHHRLRDLGHTPRAVAVVIYIACAGFTSLALLLAAPGRSTVVPVFVAAAAVLALAVQRLKVPELDQLSQRVVRMFQQRLVISHNLKLLEACETIAGARDGRSIIEALEAAFDRSEFSRLEIHLPEHLWRRLGGDGNADVSFEPGRPNVSLTFHNVLWPEQEVELRTPIWVEGVESGRLSLYRNADGNRLYTDIRLVPQRLVPALVAGLHNLADTGDSGSTGILA